MSSAIGIIPARYASTRFPGKPLHLLAGKPLLQHVWERCLCARSLDSVIVATDDMRIAEAAFAFGAEVALTSDRHRSGTDRVAEVARQLKDAAHIVNIQGDEPLVSPALIDRLVRTLQRANAPGIVTAASPITSRENFLDPNVVKVACAKNGDALYFSRAPIPHDRDGTGGVVPMRHHGIYGFARAALLRFVRLAPGALERLEGLEQLRALENGMPIRVIETPEAALGVDTPADARVAETLLQKPRRVR